MKKQLVSVGCSDFIDDKVDARWYMTDTIDYLQGEEFSILVQSVNIQNRELYIRKSKFVFAVLNKHALKYRFPFRVQNMDYKEGAVKNIWDIITEYKHDDEVSIGGFYNDCPKEGVLENINVFTTTYNIQIDISYATEILNKTYLEYSFSTNKERFSIIFKLVNKQHFSLADSESRNQPAASCQVEIIKKNATIPTLYATKYRCIAIAGDTQLLKPEITPIIETLCVIREISFGNLGLAKSVILTNKYLTTKFAMNAVNNSKYVIVPKIISHSPKSEGRKWADEMMMEIFTSVPSQTDGHAVGNISRKTPNNYWL